MKFVILTDIHMGPESYWKGVLRKINKDVKTFLENFIKEMNNNVKPNFVVILGDLIQDDNHNNDRKNVDYVVRKLKKLACPVYYAAGNHDLKNISEDELTRLFRQEKLFYSFDYNSFHFIILFSRVLRKGKYSIIIPDEQVKWLEKDLKNAKKRAVVFVHHGLSDQNLKGNPWFERRPGKCLIKNRKEVRKILEKSEKVIAVFNSHLHWDKKDIHNSIPYFTIQSPVENEKDKGIASEAYAIVSISGNKVVVDIKGNYSKKLHI